MDGKGAYRGGAVVLHERWPASPPPPPLGGGEVAGGGAPRPRHHYRVPSGGGLPPPHPLPHQPRVLQRRRHRRRRLPLRRRHKGRALPVGVGRHARAASGERLPLPPLQTARPARPHWGVSGTRGGVRGGGGGGHQPLRQHLEAVGPGGDGEIPRGHLHQ
eukprot:76905-Prorocentrum_minimum.AAC.1